MSCLIDLTRKVFQAFHYWDNRIPEIIVKRNFSERRVDGCIKLIDWLAAGSAVSFYNSLEHAVFKTLMFAFLIVLFPTLSYLVRGYR